MLNPRFPAAILISTLLIFSLSCGETLKTKELQFPPNSSEINSMKDVGQQFGEAERQLLTQIKNNNYNDLDSSIRRMELSVNNDEIFKFYDEQLTKLGFSSNKEDWSLNNTPIFAWKKNEFMGEKLVSVALIETQNVESKEVTGKYLLIYSARK